MDKVILYSDSRLLLMKESDGSYRLPSIGELPAAFLPDEEERFHFPGYVAAPLSGNVAAQLRGEKSAALRSDKSALPDGAEVIDGAEVMGLRESWGVLPEKEYRIAAKAAELLNWSDTTRFCSRCGGEMKRASEISKSCEKCGREVFPALWPAIVVLVIKEATDGDPMKEEALLVHARNLRRPEVQTLVAGFVETGESLEECVAREVKEETSLEISDIRYVGSQSWPFPHQLMLGFTARYKSGDIRFADGELTSGGFFRRDALPPLPTMPSLSRRIIDEWACEIKN